MRKIAAGLLAGVVMLTTVACGDVKPPITCPTDQHPENHQTTELMYMPQIVTDYKGNMRTEYRFMPIVEDHWSCAPGAPAPTTR